MHLSARESGSFRVPISPAHRDRAHPLTRPGVTPRDTDPDPASAAAIPKPSSDSDIGSTTVDVDKALLPLSLMK